MNILYQFNEKYAPYAGVSMTSLLYNNRAAKSICVYILGEELSEKSISRFNKLAEKFGREVVMVDTKALVEKMKTLNIPTYRGSYAANMRMFVSDIMQEYDVNDRLLYLDADTIVTGDLRELYEMPINTVGMVYDTLGCDHKYDIGLTEEEGYYNSGVILYDLKKWQDNDFTGKIIEHVKNVRSQYPSPDQDLINVVVRSEISPIPFEYNFQPHLRDYSYGLFMDVFAPSPFYDSINVEEAKVNPVIMHAYRYLGEFPWHKGNLHPFRREFDRYLSDSLWSDYVKEPSEGGLVMKIERILYKNLGKKTFLRLFKIMHGGFFRKAEKMSQDNKISSSM